MDKFLRKVSSKINKAVVTSMSGKKAEATNLPVRMYGTKEEFLASGQSYETSMRSKPFPRARNIYSWDDSINISRALIENHFDLKIPNDLLNYNSLRALGAGIQNTCSLEQHISLARHECAEKKIQLITVFIGPESDSDYTTGLIDSLRGVSESQIHNTQDRVHFDLPGKVIRRGKLQNSDTHQDGCVVMQGLRRVRENTDTTTGPDVHFFGASEIFGTHLKDEDTLPSKFRGLSGTEINQAFNHGMGGVNFIDVLNRLRKTSMRSGDVAILAVPYHKDLAFVDLVIRCTSDELFDYSHLNALGASRAAHELANFLQNFRPRVAKISDEILSVPKKAIDFYEKCILQIEVNEREQGTLSSDLKYFENAKKKLVLNDDTVFGSIAVNCNPITKGHEYLIDYARARVDVLYVLVIEEDASAVSFVDRLNLVELVCKNKQNVVVLRGGRYVCTEYIAPEYFVKSNEQNTEIDFGLESFYFGTYIAPALGITKIFLGDEPKCELTRRYNEHMDLAMPKYGIDLTIVPRVKTEAGEVISASRVRELLLKKDRNNLSQFVPSVTLDYLLNQNFKLNF